MSAKRERVLSAIRIDVAGATLASEDACARVIGMFEDDPRITAEHRSKLSGRGGFKSIISLKRDESGLLRGTRDIKLEHV